MKKILVIFITTILVVCLSGCKTSQDDDIYVLFTNDVHCSTEGDIGYPGLSAYKKELQEAHKYVALVDIGDFSSGSIIGVLTEGYGPTYVMNSIGYDVATFGNHEFDFGMPSLIESVFDYKEFDIVCSNITYTGSGKNYLEDVKPYVVKEYGNTKVAFVGVTTPYTITESTPTNFMENDEFVYSFTFGDDGSNFYSHLQDTINKAHSEADYVILLTHCGIEDACKPYRSMDIAQNTYDVDVILDGHSHSEILGDTYNNAKGKEVQIWQTGTGLNNIGQIVLTKDHKVEGLLISEYDKQDQDIIADIEYANSIVDEVLKENIGHTDFDLVIGEDRDGTFYRTVRARETNLGDLCADAFRYVYKTDIGVVNGGGVRANIPTGDMTIKHALDVQPFLNNTCVIKVTGQTILDMLEFSVSSTLSYTDDGEKSVGEFGGFLQVSGLKFSVDADIDSPVVIENEMFTGINGDRRVHDVYVSKNGEWVSLDPNEYYTISGGQYILAECGNGYTMFKDAEVLSKEGRIDVLCFCDYIKDGLNGIVSEEYRNTQERIVID